MALLIKIDEPYSSASLDPTPLFAADTFAGGRGMGPFDLGSER